MLRRPPIVCCALTLAGALLAPSSALAAAPVHDLGTLEAAIGASEKPVVLEFYADWCAPCRVLEAELALPAVAARLACANLIRVDMTRLANGGDARRPEARVQRRFDLMAFPTLVFLDRNGQEQRDLRLSGPQSNDRLLDSIGGVCAS